MSKAKPSSMPPDTDRHVAVRDALQKLVQNKFLERCQNNSSSVGSSSGGGGGGGGGFPATTNGNSSNNDNDTVDSDKYM